MGGNLRPWRSTTLRPGTTGTAETGRDERSRKRRFLFALLGAFFAFTGSFAVATWVLGLSAGSTGQAVSTGSSDLSIAAVASPTPGNLLYPGSSGDVVVAISNPNPYPVTITAIQLPADTADADGYSDSGLTTLQTGCSSSTPSGVTWSFATASSGSSHTLTTPLTVAAGGQTGNPLVVTLTDAATMSLSSPTACEDTYFAMPSLAGVTAGAGTGPATSSPTTDGWTS